MRKRIPKETVTARIKASTARKIDEIAEQNEDSRSETIRKMLEKYLELRI